MSTHEAPRVLADLADLADCAARAAPERGGALWRLAERDRQLDANMVRLPPGAVVGEHVENDLDVLLVVVGGGGEIVDGAGRRQTLAPQAVVWLPRSSRRGLRAGPEGLVYLTVHRRRPGMGIKGPASARDAVGLPGGSATSAGEQEGGEAPCLMDRICPACGRVAEESGGVLPRNCERCGEPLSTLQGP
ncbi:MAG TPA: hypothetical protein VFY14_02925 [Streptomyces sp.]|nr:hypothetical protein [Streptomyces sp.]